MKVLVLSLGHNSSAILVEDGHIVAGYEEERLSGIKADSSFPQMAISRILNTHKVPCDIPVCVSHWFLDGKLPDYDLRHWNTEFINAWFPKSTIYGLSESFTHHDAHALSAQVFAGSEFSSNASILVADGFGTHGECISMYDSLDNKLFSRIHGFKHSLGLFYQYATDYCGMKMNQHEYKMLAYETYMSEEFDYDKIQMCQALAKTWVDICWENLKISKMETSLDDLCITHKATTEALDAMLFVMGVDKLADERRTRILVSYFTQLFTETMALELVRIMGAENLIVVGGLFYNVKLNSLIADAIPGKLCVMPLAGDQGAGLGVYQHYFKDLVWPEHLFWGERNTCNDEDIQGIDVYYTFEIGFMQVAYELTRKGIVNLVQGAMEFGPRTLCHTSTLAIPTMENASIINEMNGRTNEMPFALVVTPHQAKNLFEDIDKIHKSLEYMVVTRKFKFSMHGGLIGGAHYYPMEDVYTCRPQITTDPDMVKLLEEFGPLINTSFNCHGNPIVFNQDQIDGNHLMQRKTTDITTIVVKEADNV